MIPYLTQANGTEVYLFGDQIVGNDTMGSVNVSATPENIIQSNIADIIDTNAVEGLFVSPVGCQGILRRADERGMRMNPRLEAVMKNIVAQMDGEEIDRISRVQPRGEYSRAIESGEKEKPVRKRRSKKNNGEVTELDLGI